MKQLRAMDNVRSKFDLGYLKNFSAPGGEIFARSFERLRMRSVFVGFFGFAEMRLTRLGKTLYSVTINGTGASGAP